MLRVRCKAPLPLLSPVLCLASFETHNSAPTTPSPCHRATPSRWLVRVRDVFKPVLRVLNWPIKMARNISIPRVEEDCWDWRYCAVCPLVGVPMTGFVVLQPQMMAKLANVVRS